MARPNVITPTNLGKTIVKDSLDENKWDVVIDPKYFTLTDNGIVLADAILKPIKDKSIVSGNLNGNTLELVKEDGTKITTDLSFIVPENATDTFLKSVEYDGATTELVFTVGSETENKGTYRVNVSDLLPVASEGVIRGNGTSAHPLVLKADPESGITVTEDGVSFTGSIELEDSFGESLGYLVAKGKVRLPPPIITDEGEWIKFDYSVYPLDKIEVVISESITTAYGEYSETEANPNYIGNSLHNNVAKRFSNEPDICGHTGLFKLCRFGANNPMYREDKKGYRFMRKDTVMPLHPIRASYSLKYGGQPTEEDTAKTLFVPPATKIEDAYISNNKLVLPASFEGASVYQALGIYSRDRTTYLYHHLSVVDNTGYVDLASSEPFEEGFGDFYYQRGFTFYIVTKDFQHYYAECDNLTKVDGVFNTNGRTPPVDKYENAPTRDFSFTYPKLKGSDTIAASEYFGGSIGALEMEVRDGSGYMIPDGSTVEIPSKNKRWVVGNGRITIWDKDRPAHDEEWGPVYVTTSENHAVFGKYVIYRSNQNIRIPRLGSANPIENDGTPNVTVPRSELAFDTYGNVIATLHSMTTDLYLHYTPKGKSKPRVMHIYAPDHEWRYALLDDEVGYLPYRLYSHAEIGGAIDNFVFDRTMFEPNTEIYFTTKNINKDGLESNHITFPNVNYEKSAKYFILEPDKTVTPNRVLVYATWGEHGAAPGGTNVRIVAGDNVTTFNHTLDGNGYFYPTSEELSVIEHDWKLKVFVSNYGGGDETSLQLIEVRKEV